MLTSSSTDRRPASKRAKSVSRMSAAQTAKTAPGAYTMDMGAPVTGASVSALMRIWSTLPSYSSQRM